MTTEVSPGITAPTPASYLSCVFAVGAAAWMGEAMAKIQTRCPACDRRVVLSPEGVVLEVSVETASYAFHCPSCDEVLVKLADLTAAALLILAGVRAVEAEGLNRWRRGRRVI